LGNKQKEEHIKGTQRFQLHSHHIGHIGLISYQRKSPELLVYRFCSGLQEIETQSVQQRIAQAKKKKNQLAQADND